MKTKEKEIKEIIKVKGIATVVEILNYNTGEKIEYKVLKVLKCGYLVLTTGETINPFYADIINIY